MKFYSIEIVMKLPKPRIENKKNAIRISWTALKGPISKLYVSLYKIRV